MFSFFAAFTVVFCIYHKMDITDVNSEYRRNKIFFTLKRERNKKKSEVFFIYSDITQCKEILAWYQKVKW